MWVNCTLFEMMSSVVLGQRLGLLSKDGASGASVDTTANTTLWTLVQLAGNPRVAGRAPIDRRPPDGAESSCAEDVRGCAPGAESELPYCKYLKVGRGCRQSQYWRAVERETYRLTPALFLNFRRY
eukprot:gene5334-8833_t